MSGRTHWSIVGYDENGDQDGELCRCEIGSNHGAGDRKCRECRQVGGHWDTCSLRPGPHCRCATLRPGDDCPTHPSDPSVYKPAPSPAAEPPEGLREAVARWLFEWSEECDTNAAADALLAGPLAPLLARLRDAEAVVERVEHVIALYRGYSGAYVDVAQIRRALSGDAR